MMSTSNSKSLTWDEQMLTLDEIKDRLKDMNLMRVASKAGIHYNALYRLANGGTNPSYETVQKLIAYLDGTNEE